MDDAELLKRLDCARLVLYDSIEAEDDKYAKRDLEAAYETVELVKERIVSLSAVIARVEALCDEAPEWTTGVFGITKAVSEADLRAALAERGANDKYE